MLYSLMKSLSLFCFTSNDKNQNIITCRGWILHLWSCISNWLPNYSRGNWCEKVGPSHYLHSGLWTHRQRAVGITTTKKSAKIIFYYSSLYNKQFQLELLSGRLQPKFEWAQLWGVWEQACLREGWGHHQHPLALCRAMCVTGHGKHR